VALDTGRACKGNIVAASAARGLSAKDLLEGKPDYKSLQKLEQFIVAPSYCFPHIPRQLTGWSSWQQAV
jgi:hypothetical protein